MVSVKKKMMMISASLIIPFAIIVLFFAVLLNISPGKPSAFKDEQGKILEGSISEKVFVSIGGVRQGMFIRSKNIDNPVLLFLHGGPGFPQLFPV
jgi:hypothetical protein